MPTARPVTLRDVARRANVSVATVSYVLSGKGRMAPETRKQIERLLREAGLKPRFKRYPVVYISDHREFHDMHAFSPFLQMYDGMNTTFREADVALRIEFLHRSGIGTVRAQLQQLLSYRVGAVVLDSNLRDEVDEIGRFFDEQEVPTIHLGHTVRSNAIDAVVIDSFGGAYKAVKHLIQEGHRRIATIRWNVAGDPASVKKHAGYTCALQEAGLPVRPEYVIESPYTKVGDALPGRVAIDRLLALREPPTAVFVENSFISPGLLYVASGAERELPKAIRTLDIVHFEAWHLEWVEQVMAGKLNYAPRKRKLLRINWEEVGRVAAKRLLERMEGLSGEPEVIQLVPKLMRVEGYESSLLESAI